MTYISAWRVKDTINVYERNGDTRELKRYPGIFEFYRKVPDGEYTSVFGDKLGKYVFKSWYDMKQAKETCDNSGTQTFESDIGPELKVLMEHYYKSTVPKLHYTVWDIEVDYDPTIGFSSVENPYAPINAVAIHHYWNNTSVVLAVPPPGWDMSNDLSQLATDTNTQITLCKDEKQLLNLLLEQFQDSDVISGWNSNLFDTPYLAKRIERTLGANRLRDLSFPDAPAPSYGTIEVYGVERTTISLGGRISWDYMELFKKFEPSERPSYSLEAISNEILPNLSKLSYEKTLWHLYNEDFEQFVRYNIRDTEVLKGFEDKLGYLQLANELYHSSCGQPTHIFGTIKLADLSIINHCHHVMNTIVPDWDQYKEDGQIAGAMVLTPKCGLHEFIGSIDVTSLYPSSIRCVNISPETLVGQMRGSLTADDRMTHSAWKIIYEKNPNASATIDYESTTEKKYAGTSETHTGLEWHAILNERKWAISGFGTVFSQYNEGMIPAVLSDWFAQRKQFQGKKKQAKQAADAILRKYK